MRWHSPAGYTVEVLRLSMTCRSHSQPADPAGDGEQFLVRMPGGRVAEYTKSLSRVQELVPDFAKLRPAGRRHPLLPGRLSAPMKPFPRALAMS